VPSYYQVAPIPHSGLRHQRSISPHLFADTLRRPPLVNLLENRRRFFDRFIIEEIFARIRLGRIQCVDDDLRADSKVAANRMACLRSSVIWVSARICDRGGNCMCSGVIQMTD
jgi:hypothetical protein